MTTTAARVAGLLPATREADIADAELVRRFAADRDDLAFVALVRRHGPMVFGVCRRVLRDWHLAEDAFQAAFLVLARRAPAISPPGAVGGWLHGVAYRVAKDARRSALRRINRERPVGELPDPAVPEPELSDSDLRAVIDDELRKLPAKYRELIVACDLEGQPRQPIAESLGIPEGTLSSRLTAARRMLADRLAKRGIAPAVTAGVAAGGPAVEACEVPRALAASAARIGSDATGAVPAHVAALAQGAIRAMTLSRYKIAGFALAAVAMCGLGTAYAAGVFDEPPAGRAEPAKVAAPIPEAVRTAAPNRILFFREGKLTLVDPDGKNAKAVSQKLGLYRPNDTRLSPDGKLLATLIKMEVPDDKIPNDDPPFMLHVRALDEEEPGTNLKIDCQTFAWSPDGTEIACSGPDDVDGPRSRHIVHRIVNVKTKARTPVKLPEDHYIIDWSRDGKFFLTRRAASVERKEDGPRQLATSSISLHLLNRDGTEHKCLTDSKGIGMFGRLSPDGKRVLYFGSGKQDGENVSLGLFHLWVFDLATMKTEPVANVPANGAVTGLCWSPDGKRIAYEWRELPRLKDADGKDTEVEVRLIVCDPDGKNAKTLVTEKHKGLFPIEGDVDWR